MTNFNDMFDYYCAPNIHDTPALLFAIQDQFDPSYEPVDPDIGACAQHIEWQEPYTVLATFKDEFLEEIDS